MKKTITLTIVFVLVAALMVWGVMASLAPGPAPSSGDGVSDGPGWGEDNGEPWPSLDASGPGPAPNAGDGVSDGSGWV